jgi:nucleoside phosphorylase
MISGQQRGADVLLVSSHAPDLAGMRPWLGERLDGVIRNLRVRAKLVGVGMPIAAAGTARGILAVQPRAVVMVGTCGVYPNLPQYRPSDIVIATRAVLFDHAAIARKAAFPEPMQTSIECHGVMSQALQPCHPRAFLAPIASPLAHTVDDGLAAMVQPALSCDGENLEIFAIASACAAASVPFVAALGVTNIVGSTGRADWSQFQRDAVSAAAGTVAAWMHNGAQGLPHG